LLADRGALPGWYKELIATRIASLNHCESCVSVHRFRAGERGAALEQVANFDSYETGPFTEKEKAGFRFSDLIHAGGGEIEDAAFDAMAALFSPREIIELTAVTAAFEFFPRNDCALCTPLKPIP